MVATRLMLVACLCSVAHADPEPPYAPPDFMAALPPLPARVDASQAMRMQLADAIVIAMKQNLNVVLERGQMRATRLGVEVALGEFEPTVSAQYDRNSNSLPPLISEEGIASVTFVTDDWRLSLGERLETGTRVSIDFSNSRAKSSDPTIEPLNYRAELSLSITQPLLRGFSTDLVVPRVDVLKAKIASDRERQQLAVTAADIVERTEDAYWDVVQALFRYDVEVRSEKRAEEQMTLTRRQIDAGILAPSDLIQAESTLAQRRVQVLQAEASIDQAWDVLRNVMNLPRDQWTKPIVPVELPTFVAGGGTAEDALAVAIKHRPELAQMDLDLQSALLSVRQADNNKLPQLDLGLSGSLIGQDMNYGGALGGLSKADTHGYGVVLNLTWTPLQHATAAQAEIARTGHAMAQVHREQVVQQVWFEVRDALRNQENAARQVTAAARSRELTTQSLEVEERKFMSNQTTNFVVSQRQEELANAQLAELSAVLGHKKATAALLRATGKLLAERHIALEAK